MGSAGWRVDEIAAPWGAVAVRSIGDGAPVLMLHSLALDGRVWEPIGHAVAPQGFQVLAIDARGHGSSRWDGSPFTIADLAADAAAVIERLGLGPVAVVGMSMGGCVAIDLAIGRPDLVAGLLLADTTADYGPDKADSWAARAESAVSTPRVEQLDFQVPRWFTPSFAEARPDEVRRVCELFVSTDSRAHAQACLALGGFSGTGRLAGIECPTTVLVGEDDAGTPPAMARALHDGIAGSTLEVIPGRRHFALLEIDARWAELFERLRAARAAYSG